MSIVVHGHDTAKHQTSLRRSEAFEAATRTEIKKLGEGVLVRTRAVDRGYRDAKFAQVHRQLAAVVMPVVDHDRSQHRNPRHR